MPAALPQYTRCTSCASLNTNVAIGLRDIVIASDDAANRVALAMIEQNRTCYHQSHDALAAMPSSDLEKTALKLVQEKRYVSVKFNNQILDYGMRDQNQEAQALLQGAAATAMNEQQAAIRANAALERRLSKEAYAAAVASMHRGKIILASGGIAALVMSALLAWLITRSPTTPLSQATRTAEAIAAGNLHNDTHYGD